MNIFKKSWSTSKFTYLKYQLVDIEGTNCMPSMHFENGEHVKNTWDVSDKNTLKLKQYDYGWNIDDGVAFAVSELLNNDEQKERKVRIGYVDRTIYVIGNSENENVFQDKKGEYIIQANSI